MYRIAGSFASTSATMKNIRVIRVKLQIVIPEDVNVCASDVVVVVVVVVVDMFNARSFSTVKWCLLKCLLQITSNKRNNFKSKRYGCSCHSRLIRQAGNILHE